MRSGSRNGEARCGCFFLAPGINYDRKVIRVPSISDVGPYKLFFYSAEGSEPPHVHVRRDRATAKFWLGPVRLARSREFADHELRQIQRIVDDNLALILEAWHEHFGN
jgi:hypothetical protein